MKETGAIFKVPLQPKPPGTPVAFLLVTGYYIIIVAVFICTTVFQF